MEYRPNGLDKWKDDKSKVISKKKKKQYFKGDCIHQTNDRCFFRL